MEQILINLISNAIKFTSIGFVELSIDVIEVDALPRLRFAVRDTGIGMSDEVLAKVLTPFEQGDGSITRKFGGTVLGLSITQQLLFLMGSELRFESQEFRGTSVSFELTLPLVILEPASTSKARALIACKNPFVRNSIVAVAKSMYLNHEIGQTQSYLIYQLSSAIKAGNSFDFVIVDEEISGQNLPLFESQIKKELESKGRVWSGKMVCVSSAVNLFADFDYTLTEYLQEPVTTTSLQSIINAEVRSDTKPISNQRLRNTSLLLVDDNEFNRDSARQFLEAEGASV